MHSFLISIRSALVAWEEESRLALSQLARFQQHTTQRKSGQLVENFSSVKAQHLGCTQPIVPNGLLHKWHVASHHRNLTTSIYANTACIQAARLSTDGAGFAEPNGCRASDWRLNHASVRRDDADIIGGEWHNQTQCIVLFCYFLHAHSQSLTEKYTPTSTHTRART
jgi:hypothetical protein